MDENMNIQTHSASPTSHYPRFPPETIRRATSRILGWLDRQRQRAALAELDDRLLLDIGVSRAAADVEVSRWD
jgi:uncharacterized protein YjiS (DUF1127 family)